MHAEAFEFGRRMLVDLPVPQFILEIGSRDINGSLRSIMREVPYTGIDIQAGDGVDFVGDGASYQPEGSPDLIICTEVLEHTSSARQIVLHAGDVLAQEGRLLLTCATTGRAPHSAVDGGSLRSLEFYHNVTATELMQWLGEAGLTVITMETHLSRGDLYTLAAKL